LVTGHSVDEFREELVRDLIPVDGGVKRRPTRMSIEAPLQGILECVTPVINGSRCSPRLVTEIVGVAHERIDHANGVSFVLGQEPNRIVEIASSASDYRPAIIKGEFQDFR